MKTFLLENREIVFRDRNLATVSGVDCLRQRLNNRVKLFAGEWFLAPSDGIAWIELLSEKSNIMLLQSEIRRAILADSEVDSIESLILEEDSVSRSITIKFTVKTKLDRVEGEASI